MVDEQNAHTEEQEDFRKDSEEENRDNEKDEDTKELEALACEFTLNIAVSSETQSVLADRP